MPVHLTKEEIIPQLIEAAKSFSSFANSINDELFFYQPAGKWSVAQNITHLIIATKSTIPAFSFPKFIVRWYAGKPNRPSRTYDELVAKYKLKLEQGGRASGRFIPKQVASGEKKENILQTLSTSINQLASTIQKKWEDTQLDDYIAPHPLLGKITLRELCYFTIYHTNHHLLICKERLKN